MAPTLAPLFAALDRCTEIALDTEADNLFRYKTRVCLLQIHAVGEIYLVDLLADLDRDLGHVHGRELTSIFFGGGTPSLFSAAAIDRLLAAIRARVPLAPDAEITLEANPESVKPPLLDAWAEAGVNRLSLGAQSFSDRHLEALGRIQLGEHRHGRGLGDQECRHAPSDAES